MSRIMKMPMAKAVNPPAAPAPAIGATNISPTPHLTKHTSPVRSNNSSPTKERSERILHGGHYTPQSSKEHKESGNRSECDREVWDTQNQMMLPTTTTITIRTNTSPIKSATVVAPIPKQRSPYSLLQNTSSAAAKEQQQRKEPTSGNTDLQMSEKRGSSATTTTRLTAGVVTAEREEQQSQTSATMAGGDNNDSDDGAVGTTMLAATAVACVGSGNGEGDGGEYMAAVTLEKETTTRQSAAAGAGRCGTYAVTSKQSPSTAKAMAGSPTGANISTITATTTTPPSPSSSTSLTTSEATQSQSSQQFHSKSERELTYTEQRGTPLSAEQNTNTVKENNTTNTGNSVSASNRRVYHGTTSVSPLSNYTTPPLSNCGSGKVFSKLHNNQFLKNQQQLQQAGKQTSAAAQSNVTARYLKYKSQSSYLSHTQELAGGTETGSDSTANTNSNSSGLPDTLSPTNSFVAPTAIAIKKKMVAVQEMKKTTQPSGNHGQLHPHRSHHNHQQMIGVGAGGGGGGGTCARPPSLTGGRARPPSQSEGVNFDPAEDLSYGPGIVSKLRCRYLSLAFRESMEKERHCLDNLRRATSLNNLLDRDEQQDEEEPEDELDGGDSIDVEMHESDEYVELRTDVDRATSAERKLKTQGGILKYSADAGALENSKKATSFQKNAGIAAMNGTRVTQSQFSALSSTNAIVPDTPRSRHAKRGNDSLKRASSVEALLCERSPWQYVALNRTSYQPKCYVGGNSFSAPTQPTCVTIEDKIHNARSRLILGTDVLPPKRLTSVIDDTERPPPDLVKQTLMKFEATANRRGRGPNRANGTGEVANKVATYKTIIKENKPAIVFPKPPLSPTKKLSTSTLSKPATKSATGATDLLSSPLGRKTATAAVLNTPPTAGNVPASVATSSVVPTASVGLSEHSTDIIPRHKLLTEKCELAVQVAIDSPVTALTKKLEKLRLDATDKQQQTLTTGVTTKETTSLVKQQPLNKQSHSALEANTDNEIVNNSELNNDNSSSSKLVGGIGEGMAVVDNDAALEDNNKAKKLKAKQNNDRASISEPIVEPDAVQAGTAAISSDVSDDDDGLVGNAAAAPTKHITRTALDNIARAGTTQQFKFAESANSAAGHMNVVSKTAEPKLKLSNLNPDITNTLLNATSGKQIGVIRPLLTTNAAQQANANANTCINSTSNQLQHMEALKQHNAYNTSPTTAIASTITTTHSTIYHTSGATATQLTSREIEKNRINEMKKTVALADGNGSPTATAASATVSTVAQYAANASLNTVINTNASSLKSNISGAASTSPSSSSSTSGFNELDAAAPGVNNSPLWALRKKRQTPSAAPENTTMVFNFSNRKEVPDYIENDGVIFRRKRELPKPNESGFVLLGDLSLETSTDLDYDDFSMCPPSPCDVEFENANIVIDGKSSIRQKSKEATFRVQFNDTLTSTFEYPSEASLIVEESFSDQYCDRSNDELIRAYENLSLNDSTDGSPARHHHVAVDEIIQLPTPANTSTPATNVSATNTPTKNILGNLPLGSAPLGFYTPVKAPIDNLFQLGVTRAPNGHGHAYNNTSTPTTNGTASTAIQNGNSNGSLGGNVVGLNGGSGSNATTTANVDGGEESESLQYIKPTHDDLTIAYSEGAQKTDLLY